MSFAEIVGHRTQIEFLRRARAGERLAHAILFSGPAGIGKRLVADALAGWIVCEAGGDDGCGDCAGCRQLAAGSHPDVLIVVPPPGKRDIPIDRAREMNRFLRLQRIRAPYRVAIVDDAHLLNLPAQNALLKGLEEPPPQSATILIAPNADALLPTVRSRSQRLVFGPLSDEEVLRVLVERAALAPEEARDVARFADGSPGRALRLRSLLVSNQYGDLSDRLARPEEARYGALVQMATELSRSEDVAAVALESLLRRYRSDAEQLAVSGEAGAAVTITRRADLVVGALSALRRRNPNRQLLLESLLLRLARV